MRSGFPRDLSRVVCQVVLLGLFLDTSAAREVAALDRGARLVAGSEPGVVVVEAPAAGEGRAAPARWQGALEGAGAAIAEGFSAARREGGEAVARVAAVSASVQDEAAEYLRLLTDQAGAVRSTEQSRLAPVPSRPPPPMPPGLRLPAPGGPAAGSGIAGASALVDLSQVPLLVGPNLISLPNEPPDPDPAVVLAPIAGQFTRVFAYDNCDAADPWKVYDPADPAGSDLAAIDHRLGLWVDATAATSLPSDGVQPPSTQIQLCTGWNLVGYPLMQPRPVPAALASIAGKYLRVFGFELGDAADEWEVFDIAAPEWANDLQMMQPGRGYWVLATEDVVLDYQNEGAPPTVDLIAPADLAEVTAITDVVGTVASNLLDRWTVSVRPAEDPAAPFVELFSGNTPVQSALLGRVDPTLLLNGLYDLRLQATDFQGQTTEETIAISVDGQSKIGNFTLTFTDLVVPLSGLDLEIRRVYDSRDKKLGDFGFGWRLEISQGTYRNNRTPGEGWQIASGFLPCQTVQETRSHDTTIRISDEEIYRFRLQLFNPAPTIGGCFAQARFAFVDGPTTGATLGILGNTDVFWANGSNEVIDIDTFEVYEPQDVRLTTRDKRVFDLDLVDGVGRLVDHNGNEIQITPSSISHSDGSSIAIIRNAQGLITQIDDPLGASLLYLQDANDDLVTFTDRDGNSTTMTYNSSHGLLDVMDPLGNQAVRNEYDAQGRLVSTTDAKGNTISFAHDLDARREVVTNRIGGTRVLEYDERGNVTRELDELGKETLRAFDGDDNLLTETDPLGRTTTWTYNAANDILTITDPTGATDAFTYDAGGRVLTHTDPRGGVTTNVYDVAGNLIQTTDALGGVRSFTYDSRGNRLTETNELGDTRTSVYDARGNLIEDADFNGNATTFTYSANNDLLSETRTRTLPGGGTETRTTTFAYDEAGRRVSSTFADGSVERQAYDELGRLVRQTDPLGRVATLSYDERGRLTTRTFPDGTAEFETSDAAGRVTLRTDRAGRATTFSYDAVGNLLSVGHPDGTSEAHVYDDAGQRVASSDELGNTTTFAYDGAGRISRVTDALGNETEFTYDAAGNRLSMTDARGNTTSFAYDALNRLTATTFPDGTTTTEAYDAAGRRISHTDQAGEVTLLAYDAGGRLTSVTDALGQVTSYAYDEVDNLLGQTDANGNTTSFGYDVLGRQTSRVFPDGSSEGMAFNLDGTLATRTDHLGRVTSFSYDVMRRVVRRDQADGVSVTWAYTATDRRAAFTDARGTTSFAYDARDRVTSMTYPDGRRLDYTYDDAGNRISLTATTGASSFTTGYSYDALNRLTTVTDSTGGAYGHAYDGVGNLASVSHPNGVATSHAYDGQNRLSLLSTSAGASTLQSYSYTLDATGRRTRIDETDGTSRHYTYDALHRLTQDRVTDGAAALVYSQDFTYDPVGNRLSLAEDDGTGAVSTTAYTYDSRDRLLTEGGTTYAYDANGALLSESGTADYAWDSEGRLSSATLADGTLVEHLYDPDGNRVRTETTPSGGATVRIDYLVDTSGELSHVVAETDAAGSPVAHYVRGHALLSLLRPGSGERRYYHADGLGSVRLLTDPAAAVTDSYTYTAFGELLDHAGSDPQPYRFAGEPFDPNIGFSYHRARWLDSGVGRFVSTDAFAGSIYDPQSLHRYLYAHVDPVNNLDPTGNFTALRVAISFVIQGILRAMAAIRAFAILISVKATAIIAGGGALLISRSGQLLGLLRGTGTAGVRALQTLFFRLQGVVTQAQAAASSPFVRETMNKILHGLRTNLPNIQWHHIVEQNAANTARFGARAIQSVANVVPTPAHVHQVITRFYNSGSPWLQAQGFSTFRAWLQAQPWEQHYQIGLQIWRQAMRTGRITWP